MKIDIEQLDRGAKIVGATLTADPILGWFVISWGRSSVTVDGDDLRATGQINQVCDLIALVASCEER